MRPKTIICDIDGTIVKHSVPCESSKQSYSLELLPGTIEKFQEWDRLGYTIILITGRRESMRKVTESQLSEIGIFYDQLIMGAGSGTRVLINDMKPGRTDHTSISINLERNIGINNIII